MDKQRIEYLAIFHQNKGQEYLKAAYADGQLDGSLMLEMHRIHKDTSQLLSRLSEYLQETEQKSEKSENTLDNLVYYILTGNKTKNN